MFNSFLSLTILFFLLISPVRGHNLTLNCPHKTIPFHVELAEKAFERRQGLMFRTQLQEDEGMLFLFHEPQPIAMWMKNTPLSLDMIFCDQKGKVLAIYEKTQPFSLKNLGPVDETTQVLEIKGGTVEKQGITRACILTLNP